MKPIYRFHIRHCQPLGLTPYSYVDNYSDPKLLISLPCSYSQSIGSSSSSPTREHEISLVYISVDFRGGGGIGIDL
ncbi:hypothetical protein DVH24_010645 [Malus domestica]|uniref:Uncharacterized protein n=1 Tax=Malus domestica TaxID=3750 RepID=A0A498JSA4_MALDO|nr:hypothetical protein DVH24_010645 [Malus domestica]